MNYINNSFLLYYCRQSLQLCRTCLANTEETCLVIDEDIRKANKLNNVLV